MIKKQKQCEVNPHRAIGAGFNSRIQHMNKNVHMLCTH